MTLPIWQAAHAYLAGARVTPVSPNGTVWQALDPGTSAGAEPTWPTAEPWTVVDGSLTWGLASSFRQNAVAGIMTTLNAFKAANPTLLLQTAAARPRSLTNVSVPFAYVTGRDEVIPVLTVGIRTRQMSGLGVVVVDVTPDNVEAESRMDLVIDGLVDAFTAAYHAISGYSILQPVGVTSIDPTNGDGSNLIGELISLGATFVTEGRS